MQHLAFPLPLSISPQLAAATLMLALETVTMFTELYEYHLQLYIPHGYKTGVSETALSTVVLMATCSLLWFEIAELVIRITTEERCILLRCGRVCYWIGWPADGDIPQEWFRGSASLWTGIMIALASCVGAFIGFVRHLMKVEVTASFSIIPYMLALTSFVSKYLALKMRPYVWVRCSQNGRVVAPVVSKFRGQKEVLCPICDD